MPAGQLTTLKLVLRAARLPVVTLFLHTTHEVRCDLCDKPQQQGETDVITFFAGETNEEPVQKSMDVCRTAGAGRSRICWPSSASWVTCSARAGVPSK